MNITKKLYLSFSLISIFLILSVLGARITMDHLNSRFDYIKNNIIESIISLSEMRASADELIIWMYRHHSTEIQTNRKAAEDNIRNIITKLSTNTEFQIKNYTTNNDDKKNLEDVVTKINIIKDQLPNFINDFTQINSDEVINETLANNGIGKLANEIINAYKKTIKSKTEEANEENLRSKNNYKNTTLIMITSSIIMVILLGFLAFKTINSIRKDLNSIKNIIEESNVNLNLTLRANEKKTDEIGLTAKAFNSLMDKIITSLSRVSNSSNEVSSASLQISAGNESLSSRTEEQAASLEQIASSMSELTDTVQQTAENTKLASNLSQKALTISDENSNEARNLMKTMLDIKNSAEKVYNVVSIIDGIAFQTNILALNAAVEAARAGEQGKGFAVVAGEVRNLAQKSAVSAREIKSLVEMAMSLFEVGAVQSKQVEDNILKINNSIREISSLSDDISIASNEQSMGINQIHKAVSQMDDVTQQNSALVEESASASNALMNQATMLNDLINEFIITPTTINSFKNETFKLTNEIN